MLPVTPILPFWSLSRKSLASSLHAGKIKLCFLLDQGKLVPPCQQSCAGFQQVEACRLMGRSFFLDNTAVKTPFFLSLLWGIRTRSTITGVNNQDRAMLPTVFFFLESSWLITWHTTLRERDGNIQMPSPAASWELHSHSSAGFPCNSHTYTHTQPEEPWQRSCAVERGPETTFLLATEMFSVKNMSKTCLHGRIYRMVYNVRVEKLDLGLDLQSLDAKSSIVLNRASPPPAPSQFTVSRKATSNIDEPAV